MVKKIETVIVGGGQAGLSLSYYLSMAGREHVILEKATRVAEAWRNHRWDSFALNTPNWSFRLPGAEYSDADPHGFMLKDEIVRRFEQFELKNHFPVSYSTLVERVEPMESAWRYRTYTDRGIYESKNVVLATGMFQRLKIPPYASPISPEVLQLRSDDYRNPQSLPPGAVLVVGSAQSGCQITQELNEAGRKVYLSTCSAGRLPRRYRGLDGIDWMNRIGFFDRSVATMDSPRDRVFGSPHCSSKRGGHEVNLHQFYRNGIILLGHLSGYEDGKMLFAPDLKDNLTRSEAFTARLIQWIEGYIQKTGMNAPAEEVVLLDDGFRAAVINSLDIASEGISTIIWATGYAFECPMTLPLIDSYGYPITDQGVTSYRGLYFLGMPWMNKMRSGLLLGIADSAQYLAEVISND